MVVQMETSLSSWNLNPRIANPPPGLLAKYARKEREFYYDYANFLVRIIGDPNIKDRLRRIVAMEVIRIGRPIDLRIMVFPAKGLPGRSSRILHGSYNQTFSQISLYPLKLPRIWIRGEGQTIFKTRFHDLSNLGRKIICEIAITGLSTLIHEILHVKFENRGYNPYAEEAIVRKLEAHHTGEWGEELDENIARILADGIPS
jgi:hypothetical protein